MGFLYPQWDIELLALINAKNGSSFKRDELIFTINREKSVGGVTQVDIAPAEGVAYYGDAFIVYGKRDVAKAFLGLPLRFVVNAETTVSAILTDLSAKYGVSLDLFVDFAEAELNKTVDFTESGLVNVEIPIADTSYVWSGELALVVANDTLDLVTIIEQADLTQLSYLSGDAQKAAVPLALIGVDWMNTPIPAAINALNPGDSLAPAVCTTAAEQLVTDGIVDETDAAEIANVLAAGTFVNIDELSDGRKAASFTGSASASTTWGGNPIFVYGESSIVPVNLNALLPATWTPDLQALFRTVVPAYPAGESFARLLLRTTNPSQYYLGAWNAYARHVLGGNITADQFNAYVAGANPTLWTADNLDVKINEIAGTYGYEIVLTGKNVFTGTTTIRIEDAAVRTDDTWINLEAQASNFPDSLQDADAFNQVANAVGYMCAYQVPEYVTAILPSIFDDAAMPGQNTASTFTRDDNVTNISNPLYPHVIVTVTEPEQPEGILDISTAHSDGMTAGNMQLNAADWIEQNPGLIALYCVGRTELGVSAQLEPAADEVQYLNNTGFRAAIQVLANVVVDETNPAGFPEANKAEFGVMMQQALYYIERDEGVGRYILELRRAEGVTNSVVRIVCPTNFTDVRGALNITFGGIQRIDGHPITIDVNQEQWDAMILPLTEYGSSFISFAGSQIGSSGWPIATAGAWVAAAVKGEAGYEMLGATPTVNDGLLTFPDGPRPNITFRLQA